MGKAKGKELIVKVEIGPRTSEIFTRELLKLYDRNKHILLEKNEDKNKEVQVNE